MPNCASGGDGDHANADYCHAPLQAIATKPCEACQGDCNFDSDCAGKLQCFQRSGNEAVPGCKIGGSGDRTEYDYCYEPFAKSYFNSSLIRKVKPFHLVHWPLTKTKHFFLQ